MAGACAFAVGEPPPVDKPAAAVSPLGAPDSVPTPDRPVGWRGDGTGRYPGAKPPLVWERRRTDRGYTTTNILWSVKLPDWSVASPIVVGDRIFITAEPGDMVCLDKRTGRILWIRSNVESEGIPEEELKVEPAYASQVAPLIARLAATNEQVMAVLNAAIAPDGVLETGRAAIDAVLKAKRALQSDIYKSLLAIDKKKYDRYWAQAVFGFAGPTPCSDGKQVYVFFTTGITACYDLDGHRKWIVRGKGGCSEHGNFASPIVVAGKVVVWAAEMRAYDTASGRLAWRVPGVNGNTYGSMFTFKVKDADVAAFQSGFFVAVRDGQPVFGAHRFGDSTSTPVVEDGSIYAWVGYPRNAEGLGFKSYRIPETLDGKLAPTKTFKIEWDKGELADADMKHPFDRSFVASPLYVDGLIYQLSEGGGLVVSDAKTGDLVYRKVLDMKPKTSYWNWAGASASPTLAGQHIYLMDNRGTTVVIKPGRAYVEEARNVLENLAGKEQEQNLTTPVFDGERMYYRGHEYLYCIGN